jgi:hypothetical protein
MQLSCLYYFIMGKVLLMFQLQGLYSVEGDQKVGGFLEIL